MRKNYIPHACVWVVSLVVWVFLGYLITTSMNHHPKMNHNPMQMSMEDMWAMLQWKTWDELDKAFLEWMIPHHQWAIDMAQFLVEAKHPELQKMWEEIISAQQAEIDQMNRWLIEWWYKN